MNEHFIVVHSLFQLNGHISMNGPEYYDEPITSLPNNPFFLGIDYSNEFPHFF